jgi:hypothetical protein
MALATVYQKHSSVLTLKVDVYRMTRARCWKVKEGGQLVAIQVHEPRNDWSSVSRTDSVKL